MTEPKETTRRWVEAGDAMIERILWSLGTDDPNYEQPSELPGWTRKHLLAHVAANADAVGNLVTWARTGIETPMYSSTTQRADDIEKGSKLSAEELVAWYERSARELAEGWDGLDDAQWDAQVKTAQGRLVPASETPWMRAREVLVHAVDFGDSVSFADLPADFCAALVTDIVGKRSKGGNPAVVVVPTDSDERWEVTGEGAPVTVTGPLDELTAYLAGRPFDGVTTAGGEPVPALPPW
ncbi:MAG TPA: maleylpyruvate isomerase family mycothiol-dependent enzyme, partial [Actinomycetaceae bacterium]|nr:maleylpyruvate isomerase family mycothiol-dependent enzyme [Actinomycetaceae bacterium]